MFRFAVILIAFLSSISLVGCRACWGPYDHCQPTFVPEAGDKCMGDLYRNGSILGGMERRTNESGCSSCSGGCSESGYSENETPNQNLQNMQQITDPAAPGTAPLPGQYGNPQEPYAEPLPPQLNQGTNSSQSNEFLPTGQKSELPEQFPLMDDSQGM